MASHFFRMFDELWHPWSNLSELFTFRVFQPSLKKMKDTNGDNTHADGRRWRQYPSGLWVQGVTTNELVGGDVALIWIFCHLYPTNENIFKTYFTHTPS